MKKLNLLIFVIFLVINKLSAQTGTVNAEKEFESAEKIFSAIYLDNKDESTSHSKRGYADALPVFSNLYKQDPTNMNLAFKTGICYQATRRNRVQAIPYFEKAVTSVSADYSGSSFKEKKSSFNCL